MNGKDARTMQKGVELQHRHFCAIADGLRRSKPESHFDPERMAQWRETVFQFIAICKCSNGRFNVDRFRSACGWED